MGSAAHHSLCIRIDHRASTGLRAQIYGGIRRAILDGVLAPGSQLLSSRALAEDLGVSRTTTLLASAIEASRGPDLPVSRFPDFLARRSRGHERAR
jgi:DNA-binding transcriptional regulator YhcF (GntR family)